MHFLTNYFNIDELGYMLLLLVMVLTLLAMIYGSHYILRGASNIARLWHISEFAIGITLVAISTSLPELFVSIDATTKQMGVISLANVVGSNIFNISLIFMLLCFFSRKTFIITKQSVIFLNALNVCVLILSLLIFTAIPRWVGGVFILMLLLYFYWELTHPDKTTSSTYVGTETTSYPHTIRIFLFSLFLIVLGIFFLNLGAEYFLKSAKVMGNRLGMSSDKIIGILFIALGTSLPELVVTISAVFQILFASKGNEEQKIHLQDLASGNLVGSNIINILGVLGTSILIKPLSGIDELRIDIVFMLVSCTLLILLLYRTLFLQKCLAVFQLIVLLIYAGYIMYFN